MQGESEHRHNDDHKERRPFQPADFQRKLVKPRDADEYIVDVRQSAAVHCHGKQGDDYHEGVGYSRADGNIRKFLVFHRDEEQGKEVAQPKPEAKPPPEKFLRRHCVKGQISARVEVCFQKCEVEHDYGEKEGREQFRTARDSADALAAEINDGQGKHDDHDVGRDADEEVDHQEYLGVNEINESFERYISRKQQANGAVCGVVFFGEHRVRAAFRKEECGGKAERVQVHHKDIQPQGVAHHFGVDEAGEGGNLEDYAAGENEVRRLRIVYDVRGGKGRRLRRCGNGRRSRLVDRKRS